MAKWEDGKKEKASTNTLVKTIQILMIVDGTGRLGGWEGGREGGGGRDDCYTYSNRYVQFFLYRNVLPMNSNMMHAANSTHN